MSDLDPELIEKTIRWCADAGRQATPALVRAALAPLGWDELLAVRALLADPPPVRPLGPFALADVARGAPADVAAERERGGLYREAVARAADGAPSAPAPAPAPRSRKRARAPFQVRRASERRSEPPPATPSLPLLDELLLEEGRAVLERLVRRHGGRRSRIVEALAAGWRRADAATVASDDLDRLLAHHGMAGSFAIRERDELLHALRAAGGVRARAAEAVGLDAPGLDAALGRLGANAEAERLREQRRRALRARGTLTQRTHLLLDDTDRISDLGLLEEFVADLRARLPDHMRALATAGAAPLVDQLCRSLALDREGVERLAQRTGLSLSALPPPAPHNRDRGAAVAAAPARTGSLGRGVRARTGSARPPSQRRAAGAGRPSEGGRPGAGPRTGP
ncbi:MAG TPA: helix-turn-helix domain-containing protein, partial [Anaeromyxobacteraceae bacterium]|nr:helix-turn-helix domain-containing protein [Anaeromyxobacteraceae bacterium]